MTAHTDFNAIHNDDLDEAYSTKFYCIIKCAN